MADVSPYDLENVFERIENELIDSMMRNFARHRDEEDQMGIDWSMWQAEQLKTLEAWKKANAKKYPGQFAEVNKRIETLLRKTYGDSQLDQEREILEAIRGGFLAQNQLSDSAEGSFFKLNEQKLDALIKSVTGDFEKAETAILRRANDQYRQIIYAAQVYANTGAGTYEQAVDMATKDFLSRGIDCVEYKNGARHNIKDYSRMAIRTANKRAQLQGEGDKRKEWGISTVIVHKRGNPCPKCLPFTGKVFVDDVWSGGGKDGKSSVTGAKYPLMSTAIAAGLYHPNCKDGHSTYYEGVNDPPDDRYTRDELDALAEKYQKEQKAQYAKRQAEKYERLAKYSMDPENQKKYAARAKRWEEQSVWSQAIEHELSPRKATRGDFGVNWPKVQSTAYRESLEKLSNDSKVVDAIETRVKWALNNRNGLKTEELYALSLNTGEEIASILGQQIEFGVKRTPEFIKKLDNADETGMRILLLHNHPRGLPPSVGDINALLRSKNAIGITVGHDGSIYLYTRPEKEISRFDFDIAIRKYRMYTEVTSIEKALAELTEKYGFEFEKL